ncbi:TonB-dependent receptor domain-containing protein [Erwinia sp. V71]|uniref:TonB-dependent receptor domain-containing protein n=1 Tax=Erwinia sp. V71 TaxID=3369424 RepID=UPI003F643E34
MIWGRKHGSQQITRNLTRLLLIIMLVPGGGQVWAAETGQDETQDTATSTTASDTLTVTESAPPPPPPPRNDKTGASKEDVERRGASHLSDVIDQVSGTSMNSLYARPDVSVGIQGVAGHGRVTQQLEGVTQNFHAFTSDIGQTGSIFVEPQFLQSMDVSRGTSSGTGSLGGLGSTVDFRYLDLDDVLRPGQRLGGMVRGSTGFSEYANGQKPSGSLFLAGRDESWEVMLGASHSKNDAYKVGSNFNDGAMLNEFHATNLLFATGSNQFPTTSNCAYAVRGIAGGTRDGLENCQMTPQQLAWFQQATKSGALKGTERETESQLLRLRHYFNDEYAQSLELFATASHAKYKTDLQPYIRASTVDSEDAAWTDQLWSVDTKLDNQVVNLKYNAAFSELINPQVQLYHEEQERKQSWTGIAGSNASGWPLHYDVNIQSTGLKLANTSHFSLPVVGDWRFDAGVEMRRADKKVDSFNEDDALKQINASRGIDYTAQKWDTDSRDTSQSIALNLSTDGDTPWQFTAGVGFQRLKMDIYSPNFMSGNVSHEGTKYTLAYFRRMYIAQGYSTSQAIAMARETAAQYTDSFKIDTSQGTDSRYVSDNQQHHFNLKSGNIGTQYTLPDTGLSTYASLGYSERAPTSNEMYTSGAWMRQLFVTNPDLKPEKNVSLQLGVNYNHHAWLTDSDEVNVGVGFYRNRIRNYIGYGPMWMRDDVISGDAGSTPSAVGNVNNLEAVIRQGFELNLAYQQPLFYIRSNLTLPLRHDNKMCSVKSPSGNSYYKTTDASGNTVYTRTGSGGTQCYSGWNWMETSLIEPIRGSVTAALTPYSGQLEMGATLHYRGKQRAAYWYVKDVQDSGTDRTQNELPDNDGWLEVSLWPKTFKVDLFANYHFSEQFKVGVYLANLTDQFDGTTTSMGYNFYPGRTLTANMEYRF